MCGVQEEQRTTTNSIAPMATHDEKNTSNDSKKLIISEKKKEGGKVKIRIKMEEGVGQEESQDGLSRSHDTAQTSSGTRG